MTWTVRRPDKADRTFEKPEEAIAFMAKIPGPAKLFGPEGLLMSKGTQAPN